LHVAADVALLRQSSASLALPSSHSSPCSLTPLPQWMTWQVVEHVLSEMPFIAPSSHSSVRASILPSPQVASLHDDGAALLLRQSSVSLWLPSSHCSPGSRMPLPHCSMWQFALHTWPPVTPSVPSHSSPGSLTPLPQCSNRQLAEQPLATDGGSHCSGSVPLGLN
jgi:hypothetical protein